MAGPHSPNHGVDADEPSPTDPDTSQAAPPSAAYPGPLPPPVPYPKRSRWPLIIGVLVAVALLAALGWAIVFAVRGDRSEPGRRLSDMRARTAIQGYLDALENRDIETVTRNTLCGIYDAVRDRRADDAVARLSSDAFRKQFSGTEVTSIDKVVYWSNDQAQVLFSMRVVPTTGGPPHDQVQGIAQLLAYDNQLLVCSYMQRTSGTY